MENKVIKREEVINVEKFNRDAEKLKATIRFLEFLNKITFKLFEKRLLVQLDIIMENWNDRIKKGEYMV